MYSKKFKRQKFNFEIVWLITTTIFSLVIVLKTKQTIFWTYALLMYIIPIAINLVYFSRIYDCYEDEKDFNEKFRKKYGELSTKAIEVYFKKYETCNKVIRYFSRILFLGTLVFIFLTFQFPEVFQNSITKYILYTILYFFYFLASVVEKMMCRNLNEELNFAKV